MRDQIEKWQTDRKKIALDAIDDLNDSETTLFTIYNDNDNELVGIATLRDGELLNLATKRRGYGQKMLEKIAKHALNEGVGLDGLSTDQAVFFYAQNGWTVEGYPGDNNGVLMTWYHEDIERFVNDQEAFLLEAAEICAEYRADCES